MLRENWRTISAIEKLGDVLIVIASFFIAYYLRSSFNTINLLSSTALKFEPTIAPLKDYFIVLFVSIITYLTSLTLLGSYGSMRLSSVFRLIKVTTISSVFTFITLASILFIFKIDLSRSFLLLFCGISAVLISFERMGVILLLRYWRKRGKNYRNIMICGVGEQAVKLAREIRSRPEIGIQIKAFVDFKVSSETENLNNSVDNDQSSLKLPTSRTERLLKRFSAEKIVKGLYDFETALKELAIDEVIFTDIAEVMNKVGEAILICSDEGVRTTLAGDLFSIGMAKSDISYFNGMPLIHYQTPPGDGWELKLKRFIDILISFIALILVSPFFLFAFIGVKLSSKGPVLFKQKRVGLNGRIFSLYKFRSMYVDAENMLAEIEAKNEMTGPLFKMTDDPRVTKFGRFIRKYSIDELPQLWNVFRGDMSLVGPRPPIPGEVSLYGRRDRRRLSMRPGLTCLWQVSGRNKIKDFNKLVELDLKYIDNCSLYGDFVLLFKTIPVVFGGKGV